MQFLRKLRKSKNLRLVISLVLLLLATIILLPQFIVLGQSIEGMKDAQLVYLAAATVLFFGTYVMAAYTIRIIALRRLNYKQVLQVQVASGFANKLAPSGIGGFALNTRYLSKQGHSLVQAGSVMALNGVLGLASHSAILLISFVFARRTLEQTVNIALNPQLVFISLLGVFVLMIALGRISFVRRQLHKVTQSLKLMAMHYRRDPYRLLIGFFGACGVTALFVASLYFSAVSLGIGLSFFEVMLVYTAGAIGTAVMPTPGGVGGTEAGLAAALMVIGIDTPTAISLALIFRLITYWLPIVPGFIFFQFVLRRRFI